MNKRPKVSKSITIKIMPSIAIFKPSSVCIRRTHHSVTEGVVASTFWNIIGNNVNDESPIERIDMKQKYDNKTNEPFWLIFVHFRDDIPVEGPAKSFSDRIDNGEEIRLQYNNRFFFKVYKCTPKVKVPTQTRILSVEDSEELMKFQKERFVANQVKEKTVDASTLFNKTNTEVTELSDMIANSFGCA